MKYGLYHGCSNTFVITDQPNTKDLSVLAIKLCKKHGTDGFIVAKRNPLEMIFYNADGSRAPMCGNGIRCFIAFCYHQNYFTNEDHEVLTLAGKVKIKIVSYDPFTVLVNLGKPSYDPIKLGLKNKNEHFNQKLLINGQNILVSAVYLGTDHAVVLLDDLEKANVLGDALCHDSYFLKQINANFVKLIDRNNIFVRTYERGVGWTLACGTGGSSSVAVLYRLGLVDRRVTVHFQKGFITVEINEKGEVLMEGPAEKYGWFE